MPKGKRTRALRVADIQVVGKRRQLNQRKCQQLAESIRAIGLRTPITVNIRKNGDIVLVAGLHRLEAMKLLGMKKVECFIVKDGRLKRELWQDSENVCRASLTALERAEATARSVRNVKKLAETDPDGAVKGGKQPGDKGLSKGARRLGLSRDAIRRAIMINRISPEAKEAAKVHGHDRIQRKLILIAEETTPEAQLQKANNLASKPKPKKLSKADRKQLRSLTRRLEKANKLRRAVAEASPIVQRRFASKLIMLCRNSHPKESSSE